MARLTDAALRKFVPDPHKRRLIKDDAARGLLLVVHPSGSKSWMMRFRQGGRIAQIVLGPLYSGDKELTGDPVVGMPQTLSSARALAAEVLRTRAQGRDPVAEHRATKLRQREEKHEREASSFAALHCRASRQEITHTTTTLVRDSTLARSGLSCIRLRSERT
jgi:hypothetical protein